MRALLVDFNDINSAMRLDGSFHLSEGTIFLKKLRKMSHEELGDITIKIFTAGRSKRFYTNKNKGFPYLSNTEVAKQNPLEGCKYNSKKFGYDEPSLLKRGMIVTGRVGAIGQTAYVTSELEEVKAMGSDNIIRIVPQNIQKSGFIYAFLASQYGRTLLWRLAAGGVQPYISEDMLKDMPIPKLTESKQKEIHSLIVSASQLRVEANKLLRESKNQFYKCNGISHETVKELNTPLERNISLSHNINIKKLSINTFRARNYSIRKQRIISLLSEKNYDRLIDVLEKPLERGGRFKRVEVSENSSNAVTLLNQGDIFDLRPLGKIISKKAIKNWEEEKTRKNLILIPALGTLGENEIFSRVQFCYGYLEEQTVAEGLMRVVPNSEVIDPGYLFTVLSSELWFRILRNSVHGTNLLGYIYPMLHSYPIPRIDEMEEKNIGEMVRLAYSKLTDALGIESDAIISLEKEIESWQE